jgi:pantoate--beta-alanine ligase
MLSIKSAQILSDYLLMIKNKGKKVGFVPTMGALHEGHMSLIDQAKLENDVVVCSIFVNPKQFGEKKDLDFYPRPIAQDMDLLINHEVDVLFLPEVAEVYPESFKEIEVDLKGLDNLLEGAQRPGHFQGVAAVLGRFFDLVNPDQVYFGQKDFQQTVVVNLLAKERFPNLKIVVVPISRESNGLARSSRNIRLTSGERSRASFIYQCLVKLKEMCFHQELSTALEKSRLYLESVEGAQLEYLEAVDGYSMKAVNHLNQSDYIVAVTVVKFGGVRLLDNIILKQSR